MEPNQRFAVNEPTVIQEIIDGEAIIADLGRGFYYSLDPIGSLGLETEDFAALTKLLVDAADQSCGGRLVSLLEGGYDLSALADSVACHLETLLEAEGD